MAQSVSQAKTSIKKVNEQINSLAPSTLLSLFTIDVTDVVFNKNVETQGKQKVFRFHNNVKLPTAPIFFQGKKYIAAPIQMQDLETSTRGALARPKLGITVPDEGIEAMDEFKFHLRELGDLAGAQVTRTRTFAKFIDDRNFRDEENKVAGFSPDPNAILDQHDYLIDRKSKEDKSNLIFELISKIDLESQRLPSNLVIKSKCSYIYRGGFCGWERDSRREDGEHPDSLIMPDLAYPVANSNDEKIFGEVLDSSISPVDRGEWQTETTYSAGHFVFIKKDKIKYYFVAKKSVPRNVAPSNNFYWEEDSCSRQIQGCNLRWGTIGNGALMFSGFPGINRQR